MITVPEPATREAAFSLAGAAIRGDFGAIAAMLDAYDVDEFVAAMHATLALVRALALKLRSPQGLMACDVWLAETSREHPSRDTRIAAQLILGHAQTCYPPTETVTVAETFGEMFNVGAAVFNQACCEADEGIVGVFVAAMVLWHHLLPEVNIAAGGCIVGNVAGQLWGIRSVEPPETSENLDESRTLRARKVDDVTPPRPTLAAPIETRAQWDDGPPARPTIPAGAPVSLRGLAILRQRERGLDL